MTFKGLKGRITSIRWRVYASAAKTWLGTETEIRSPALAWDSTAWHPVFNVANPSVPWQVQVTAYGPDGARLDTNHSNFTFATP
ncbi:hypothetical protein [Streptomyces sp. ISL-11]|uniref:hypothetical protein n=1 Tax=Streptomyces sp. ISL-11 TaxID=2819174 RepID=UPI001BE8EB6A|nr:hypothetical protein [Streptomyces sp. ISL-11]MBT2385018.1 hypothetical protein [Streptomyces sp. ISL-11]